MATINGTIITEDAITITIDCKPCTVRNDNPSYSEIIKAIKKNDGDEVMRLVNFNSRVASDSGMFEEYLDSIDSDDEFEIDEYTIKYNGIELDDFLVKKLREIYSVGIEEHISYYINFIRNLYKNPSFQSIRELLPFLDRAGLPITPDGCFLAYKTVSSNYYDKHSGTVLNSVGSTIEMPRHMVDDNRNETCSHGYHVGSWEYAGTGGWYNSAEDIVLLVKVNPMDAVSVPSDHSDQKLRVCKYFVQDEYKSDDLIQSCVHSEEDETNDESEDANTEAEVTTTELEISNFRDSSYNHCSVQAGKTYQFIYTKEGYNPEVRVATVDTIIKSDFGSVKCLKCILEPTDSKYHEDNANIRMFNVDRISNFEESQKKAISFKDKFKNDVTIELGKTYNFLCDGLYRIATFDSIDSGVIQATISTQDQKYSPGHSRCCLFNISQISHIDEER